MDSLQHYIQREIIKRLCFNAELRFSDLKPKNLENNIFMYHLKQLVKAGLVEKNKNNLYDLTPKGLAYVDKISYATKRATEQPKMVSYLVVNDKIGGQLLWRRQIQPSINQIGVPVGKIHYGEDVTESAQRELLEKAGLKNVELLFRGTANMKFYIDNVLVSHILCMVFSGQATTVKPSLISGEQGEVFWSDKVPVDNLLPSVEFINDKLASSQDKLFFAEKSFYLN